MNTFFEKKKKKHGCDVKGRKIAWEKMSSMHKFENSLIILKFNHTYITGENL